MEPTLTPAGLASAPLPAVPIRTVLAGIAVLARRAGQPAPAAEDVEVAADQRRITLTVTSVSELSAWYAAVRPRGVAVGGQYEARTNNRLYVRGRLDWVLSYGQIPGAPGIDLYVVAASESRLPDTALVRDMCPWALVGRTAGTAVAA
ncbi:hypothetical protein [Streptomyces sp. LS1784]|uniref:hypothetical protein n=1 Tax=Streptomyces sp. LS1784 TaxID=2851533 RepID=UPI001CCA083A|nr:hypothetical protein [Streptomyces sp. LS1784]